MLHAQKWFGRNVVGNMLLTQCSDNDHFTWRPRCVSTCISSETS